MSEQRYELPDDKHWDLPEPYNEQMGHYGDNIVANMFWLLDQLQPILGMTEFRVRDPKTTRHAIDDQIAHHLWKQHGERRIADVEAARNEWIDIISYYDLLLHYAQDIANNLQTIKNQITKYGKRFDLTSETIDLTRCAGITQQNKRCQKRTNDKSWLCHLHR